MDMQTVAIFLGLAFGTAVPLLFIVLFLRRMLNEQIKLRQIQEQLLNFAKQAQT